MSCDPLPASTTESQAPDLPDGVPPLRSFYLYLTSACNLRCRHCWIAPSFTTGELTPEEYMDVDLLRQAVAEAKALGLGHAKLTGGEPMLHPRFVEIVDLLTAEDLSINMETNGTLLDAELARYLKERTNLSFVSVSIDGPNSKVHDAFRGVDGAFESAVRGIEYLVAAGYRPQIIMCPHRGNVQHVEAVVDMAVQLRAASVKLNPVTSVGRGAAMYAHGEVLDVEALLELARFVRGDLQCRTPIPLILSTPLALYTVGELIYGQTGGMCQIRHILGILATGEMALCGIGRTIPELCFGNLDKVSVAEAWKTHPMLRRLRRELDSDYPDICGKCIHARHCLTYCVAMNYQSTGQLITPSWFCAEAYQKGLFPLSRLKKAR